MAAAGRGTVVMMPTRASQSAPRHCQLRRCQGRRGCVCAPATSPFAVAAASRLGAANAMVASSSSKPQRACVERPQKPASRGVSCGRRARAPVAASATVTFAGGRRGSPMRRPRPSDGYAALLGMSAEEADGALAWIPKAAAAAPLPSGWTVEGGASVPATCVRSPAGPTRRRFRAPTQGGGWLHAVCTSLPPLAS